MFLIHFPLYDTQNLGSLIRTAAFFGAEVVVAEHGSAPLAAAASKASSGVLEVKDIYATPSLANFLMLSRVRC